MQVLQNTCTSLQTADLLIDEGALKEVCLHLFKRMSGFIGQGKNAEANMAAEQVKLLPTVAHLPEVSDVIQAVLAVFGTCPEAL